MSSDEVIIRRDGRAGRLTLNRPRALNALTLGMVRQIWQALHDWARDPAVALVILDGAGDRGLCAGGDVISLYQAHADRKGDDLASTFWSEEYRLNALISRYPKPFVPIMDGLVMGGGIGLSAHAKNFRVVTERSKIAFPETTIGLIPDVGGTWLLSRAPQPDDIYSALLGPQMGPAQSIAMGFADAHVDTARLPELLSRLTSGAQSTTTVLTDLASPPPVATNIIPSELRDCFDKPSVEAICDALAASNAQAAPAIGSDLSRRSPLALMASFEAVRRARMLPSLEAALAIEYRLCLRLYEMGEFPEGIRALLIDKDRSPHWIHRSLKSVPSEAIHDLFAPLPEELSFPHTPY